MVTWANGSSVSYHFFRDDVRNHHGPKEDDAPYLCLTCNDGLSGETNR